MKKQLPEIGLAALSGLLTALAFPRVSLFFLGWISLLPLFFLLYGRRPGRGFFLGWCSGFAFYLVLLYWIQDVPAHYGGLSWGFSALIFVLFAAFLALFWGAFAALFCLLQRRFPRGVFFLAGFIWVSGEYLLSHLLTGFPWGLLGYTQYRNLMFIQISALTGVYGLSLLLILFQSSFVLSMTSRKRRPFLISVFAILVIHAGGWFELQKPPPSTRETFTGAVVQGNVQPEAEFSGMTAEQISALLERHLELSRKAFAQGAGLVVWPELSVPLCFSCDYAFFPGFSQELADFSRETGCTLLVGTNETAWVDGSPKYYNTAAQVNPEGELSFYHKRHLVPFGEYTPYKQIFGFIANFTHAIGELTPGQNPVLHEFTGIPYATPICYEIIFPDLVRRFVKQGARFLVTITNDGWYGRSWAPYQHFAMAVLRAVETRRYLLRSATTGISGAIDPYGRILRQSRLNTVIRINAEITPLSETTFYTRFGDWLSWLSLTLTGVFLILALIHRQRHVP